MGDRLAADTRSIPFCAFGPAGTSSRRKCRSPPMSSPLGKRGVELHGWHIGDSRANEADEVANGWLMRSRGAYVMGRNMFGPIRGQWDEDWRGWWGLEPPYHAPVFVLTHHAHEPIEMEGGTTFYFVTGGFEAAYAQASETAGDRSIHRLPRTSATAGSTLVDRSSPDLREAWSTGSGAAPWC